MRNRSNRSAEADPAKITRAERRSQLLKLGADFFAQDAKRLARALIGKVLVHHVDGRVLRVRIVETEAYLGPDDLASHASKGLTARTKVMFGAPGRAYVYFIYGMHEMFNIVCGREGQAHAVLVRAGEPLDGWDANLSGPGRFARGMRISRADNGLDLTGEKLFVIDDRSSRPRVGRAMRVGIDYAQHWKDAPLRFYDLRSAAVSKPKPALAVVPKTREMSRPSVASVAKTQAASQVSLATDTKSRTRSQDSLGTDAKSQATSRRRHRLRLRDR
jgi:DNA-3-methyladenine glycosylase